MAIGDIISRLLQPIIDRIKEALGPFGKVFDLIGKFFTGFRDSFDKGKELTDEIISEIAEWRGFKESIPVRTGVISLPTAIDKSQELLDKIKGAWEAIKDLIEEIKDQLRGQQGDPEAEAKAALEDLQAAKVITDLLERFPKLARGLEKLLGFLALIVGVLTTIQSTIDDLKQIVDAIKGIREEIETGSTIFLSHKNPRKVIHLTDGSTMKIRLGNLHS